MDLGINGRTALVTGASSGIGEAVALALAAEGVKLAVAARREEKLRGVAARAKAMGASDARAYALDLTDAASIDATLKSVHADFGSVDILVVNGGGPKPGKFSDLTIDDWDAGYRGVLRGVLKLVEGTVPLMRENRWGRIVALTSTSVKQPIDNLALSNAFRTALVSALRTLANEVAPDGVTVNCIATGRVKTDRLRQLYGGSDEQMEAAAAAEVPMKRVASPQEFAPLVAFLCGQSASYVTAQTIAIDGGLTRGTFG
ncbi:MAG TPA: SDR family oxidoreductase [Candidatus Cybelea sp.]|nr:SDR family oxidoreductase [Candidatus Cybelea sp.]